MEQARAAIEVTAGLIPGQPMDEFTRRWWITSEEWQAAGEKDKELPQDHIGQFDGNNLLTDRQGPAMAYAQLLMLQPQVLNWVRVDWIWF